MLGAKGMLLIRNLLLQKKPTRILLFFCSLGIVAWGQPALIGPLGAVSALFGFFLFFLPLLHASKREKFFAATLWFSSVQAIQLFWMTSLEFQGSGIVILYLVLSLFLGLQFGLFALSVTRPLSWLQLGGCSAFWALMEWSRLFVGCGFSWNPIGLSLCHFTESLQFASVVGVLGLSFWVMGVNLLFLKAVLERRGKIVTTALVLGLFPYLFGLVHLRIHDAQMDQNTKRLSAALLQTDWLPCQKIPWVNRLETFIPPLEQWKQIVSMASGLYNKPLDLLVLPEAAVSFPANKPLFPLPLIQDFFSSLQLEGFDGAKFFPHLSPPYATLYLSGGQTGIYVNHLFIAQTLSNYLGSKIVLGLDHTEQGIHFNSAFYLQPQSNLVSRYDKQILLPLAEAPPFFFLKRWLKRYGLVEFFTPGKGNCLWGDGPLFAPSICYEETFSDLLWEARRQGAQCCVNMTNDNYYPNSSLYKQHLFHARVRAVENGVPLLRACNGGGSAVIDSLGRILQGGITKKVGVISCQFTFYNYNTIFSYYGQSGVVGICFFILFFYLLGLWRDFLEANKGIRLLLLGPKK